MSDYIMPKLYQKNHLVEPDEYDRGIMSVLLEIWNSHFTHSPDHPRVGDYIITPDGKYQRAAHIWGPWEGDNGTTQTCDSGSFHIGIYGASMSGCLDPGYKTDKLINTGETKEGHFWFFHHNYQGADRSVGLSCACRVFKVVP
jgi:hypothetical protein